MIGEGKKDAHITRAKHIHTVFQFPIMFGALQSVEWAFDFTRTQCIAKRQHTTKAPARAALPISERREKQGMRTTTLKLKHIYKCMMIMINRLKRYRCLRFMFCSGYIALSGRACGGVGWRCHWSEQPKISAKLLCVQFYVIIFHPIAHGDGTSENQKWKVAYNIKI